jgi:hypothetical protein
MVMAMAMGMKAPMGLLQRRQRFLGATQVAILQCLPYLA